MKELGNIQGILVDLEGVLFVGDQVVEGAPETIAYLNRKRIARRYLTNTTTKSTETLHKKLKTMGFPILQKEIISAPMATVLYLRNLGAPTCYLLVSDEVKQDFREFVSSNENPDVIVVGDIGEAWDYQLVNKLFRMMMNGAQLIALHKGRFWQASEGLKVDFGAFIAGLEYATGMQALIIGKPSPSIFEMALKDLDLPAKNVAIIGDDIDSDVGGGKACGLAGILVTTGKYRQDYVSRSSIEPDLTLPSIKALRDLI
jgi:HAD superfamily hydrolase (TIGR01458 family)